MVRDLTGDYNYQDIKEIFSGKYQINPDGGLVGLMEDSGEAKIFGGYDDNIILGVQNGYMNRMNFLKLSNDPFYTPLLYTLENTKENNYQGFWIPLMELETDSFIEGYNHIPGIPDLAQAFEEEDPIKKMSILGKVKKSSIEEFLLPQLVGEVVEIESMKAAGKTMEGRRIDSYVGTAHLTLE